MILHKHKNIHFHTGPKQMFPYVSKHVLAICPVYVLLDPYNSKILEFTLQLVASNPQCDMIANLTIRSRQGN